MSAQQRLLCASNLHATLPELHTSTKAAITVSAATDTQLPQHAHRTSRCSSRNSRSWVSLKAQRSVPPVPMSTCRVNGAAEEADGDRAKCPGHCLALDHSSRPKHAAKAQVAELPPHLVLLVLDLVGRRVGQAGQQGGVHRHRWVHGNGKAQRFRTRCSSSHKQRMWAAPPTSAR